MSALIEVFLSLAFLFLLLAIVASSFQEIVAQYLNLRATNLKQALEQLVTDKSVREEILQHPLVTSLSNKSKDELLHNKKAGPSYIPGEVFTMALIDVLSRISDERQTSNPSANSSKEVANGPASNTANEWSFDSVAQAIDALPKDSDVRRSLMVFVKSSEKNLRNLETKVESWFDATMDRASGWYKRRTQEILHVIAAILVLVLNADAIVISKVLWNNADIRGKFVNAAVEYHDRYAQEESLATRIHIQADTAESTKSAESTPHTPNNPANSEIPAPTPSPPKLGTQLMHAGAIIDTSELPLGWSVKQLPATLSPQFILTKTLGLLLSIFAVSLGAPFWYQALGRIINLRGSGKIPPTARQKSAANS